MSDGGNNKNAHQTLPVHQRIDHELFWSVQPCIVTTHKIYFIKRSILHPKHSVQAILLLCMEMLIECTAILQITVLFELKKCTTILWICLLDACNMLNPLPWKSAHPPHRFSLVRRDRFVELISWCSSKNWFLINQSINSFFLSFHLQNNFCEMKSKNPKNCLQEFWDAILTYHPLHNGLSQCKHSNPAVP